MPFRWSTLLLVLALLGSSLAVFGMWGGIIVFVILAPATLFPTRPSCLMALPAFVLFMALLLPAANAVHDAVYRMHCMKCLTNIILALHNYAQFYKSFPPAYIADKDGRPMHSWRVLILPYIEQDELYKQYNFNEPWDGPNNKKLLKARPYVYACPDDEKNFLTPGATSTNYVAVVGADAAWHGATPRNFADFRGKTSETIMIVEVADVDIPWTEPKDVSLEVPRTALNSTAIISSKHMPNDNFFFYSPRTVVNCALADGSKCCLPSGLVASDKLPDVLKIGGAREEYLAADWPEKPLRTHWLNCMAFAVWVASLGLLVNRAVRSRKPAAKHVAENAA
jgi:hypothetical protein